MERTEGKQEQMKENTIGCLHIIFGGIMVLGAGLMVISAVQTVLSLFGYTHIIFSDFEYPMQSGMTGFVIGLGMLLVGRGVDWGLAKLYRRLATQSKG